MSKRVGMMAGLSLCMVMAAGAPAWATINDLKAYKEAYPGKEAKAYSCKTCHQGAIGKKDNLNPYGLALQTSKATVDAKKLTVEDFRAIETDDADADGASNLDEITAGTAPGDPASAPAGAGKTPLSALPTPPKQLSMSIAHWLIPEASAADAPQSPKSEEKGEPERPKQAEYVGMETCEACHAKQAKEFKQSTHARIAVPGGSGAQGCETCHGPGSLHAEAGGGKGVGGIINPRKDPSACFECHLDKKAEFRLPYRHPVMEGKMSCSDCHSPHAPDVRPWSATSLKDINEACFKCHKDQRGPFVNEHEALREGCTTCHKVHGSIHEKMLLARDSNLCLRCHTQTNFPTIGGSSHASRLYQGTCFSAGCHTAVHGSNFDEHLRY